MNQQVILLRGINVGGHHRLPMRELCALLQKLGLQNPRSYIQSGNVVGAGRVEAGAISDAIERAKGFRPQVLVLPADAFIAIAKALPFTEPDGKLVYIWFPASRFTFDQAKADRLRAETETLHITDHAIFLHAPDGIGRSKLAAKIETLAGVPCTARNMNTVRKLLQMLDA